MALVFEVYDAQGRLQLDLSNSVTKHIGTRTVSASGSFTDNNLVTGRSWAIITPVVNAGYAAWTYRAWVEGKTVRYTVSSSAGITYQIIYGIY